MKQKLEDNFPPEEFCSREHCKHYQDRARIAMNYNIGQTRKEDAEALIKRTIAEHCEECMATRYHQFVKSRKI